MDITLPKPGRYVLAISGGVDSVALLHLLQAQSGLKLTVAHFDHGMRQDSTEDRQFVQSLAKGYKLPFVYDAANLGQGASEAQARQARYDFLYKVRRASGAWAIITAHHHDDVLETAILNILRGSGRRGLTALASRHDIQRPLLGISKKDIIAYAKDQDLTWREDSTNQDEKYTRNYIRQQLLPRFDDDHRAQFSRHITDLRSLNQEIDQALVRSLHTQSRPGKLDRAWFIHLPHDVAREVMATWLTAHQLRGFDRKKLERLVVMAKTAKPGRHFDILNGRFLEVHKDYLALAGRER
jgi:tRNA(Ile)-lysidine synthase